MPQNVSHARSKTGHTTPKTTTSAAATVDYDATGVSDQDVYLFNEGRHFRLYQHLGAHVSTGQHVSTRFAVWAPAAAHVSVIGDFNGWNHGAHPLRVRGDSGIWEGTIPGVGVGAIYKYAIRSQHNNYAVEKADPFAAYAERPSKTASVVWDLDYAWQDAAWMSSRGARQTLGAPMSIYEVHLGSWKRVVEEGHRSLTYRELAADLVAYVTQMGFTHVELLPIMEHPFDGSWGYQSTGYFAPTSRFGAPQDFMYLVDQLHQADIGVILDWVPSHFPCDEHGLAYFDGTHLFEHADPKQGFHPDWQSAIFNYNRHEVRSFLVSSALSWLDRYHIDGLRVDAVASMLYLDYSRKEGEWIPNVHGGKENLAAIELLRALNAAAYQSFPDVQMIAEESTSWPMVSRPTYVGGLGFGLKWDMGWMHDTLVYMSKDSIHRPYHHNQLTFRLLYAFTENFALPLSHDEVVHGKGSLLRKMPGDPWQQYANLRTLFGYMYAQPGKKLLFMGCEFGQWDEWQHDGSVDWHLLEHASHAGIQQWVADLNKCYRKEPALHDYDCEQQGFEWIDSNDATQSVLSFLRRSQAGGRWVAVVCNFTPIPRHNYRIGVPCDGQWTELLNSDAPCYGGSGQGNFGGVAASPIGWHGRPYSLNMTLPPLSVLYLCHPDQP